LERLIIAQRTVGCHKNVVHFYILDSIGFKQQTVSFGEK
jgi:hypothetical protein